MEQKQKEQAAKTYYEQKQITQAMGEWLYMTRNIVKIKSDENKGTFILQVIYIL